MPDPRIEPQGTSNRPYRCLDYTGRRPAPKRRTRGMGSRIAAALRAVMATVSPENIDERAFAYYRRLRRLDTYCRRHYPETITLQRAADIAALERTYFSTYFRAKVGVCFSNWLSMLRVREAKRLLRRSDRPISDVAIDVGFGNLTSLERAFKRWTGTTPSDFRRRHQPSSAAGPKHQP